MDKLSSTDNGKEELQSEIPVERPKGFGQRHLQLLLLFICNGLSFGFRTILSISIVAMVDNTNNTAFESYDWNEKIRGVIFSSNFWGIFLTSALAGVIAQKYGAKRPLFIVIFCMSIISLATPTIASWGWIWMCVRQLLEGLFGGFVIASSYNLFGKWVHPSERSFLIPFTMSGIAFGKAVILALTGPIIASSWGWPGTFYAPGVLGIIWCILWGWYGSDSPLENQRISRDECEYLKMIPGIKQKSQSIPWKDILTSRPVYVVILMQCVQNWSFVMMSVSIPTYMNNVFHLNIKANAFFTALPYIIIFASTFLISHSSKWLIQREHTSIPTSRKLYNSIGMCMPAIALVIMAFSANNLILTISMSVIAISSNWAIAAGFSINHLDLSPNYAGIISGINNTVGATMSILSPMFVGFIVTDSYNPSMWKIVFLIAAVVFFIGNAIFLLFGEFSAQDWNEKKKVNACETVLIENK